MYNADDAIARIDSYIISITGAANVVGERKMVRIESVERASAVAELLPEEAQPEEAKKKPAARKKPNQSGGGGNQNRKPKQENGNERAADSAPKQRSGISNNGAEAKPKAESAPKEDEDGENADKPVKSGPFGLRRGRRRRGRKKADAGS